MGEHPAKGEPQGQLPFSGWVYRQRNLVERFFNRIKQFRGIATRYDNDPENFLAAVKFIAARIWRQSLCVGALGPVEIQDSQRAAVLIQASKREP